MHTLRICSKSSLNPSATEAIQNFLNFSLNICSFFEASFVELFCGMNGGIIAGGGDGDMDCFPRRAFLSGSGLDPKLEEESDDSEDSSSCGGGGFIFSLSEDDEDVESEDEDEDAARLFRFLLRFLAAAGFGPLEAIAHSRDTTNMVCTITRAVIAEDPHEYESQHVHAVYDQIASHFSSTRYKVNSVCYIQTV
jgi:hypothetical protein